MKRRDFVKQSLPAAITLPALINGFSVKAHTGASPLVQALLGAPPTDTDKVLVLIQLNGGNDGLNMVIPVEFYSNYYNARKNIAIPQNKILTLNGTAKTGLHPGMTGMQTLYNEGKLSIVQSVGIPSPNFSHFRATDIWMSASDPDEIVNTGWAGRYLGNEFPNYPVGYPNAQVTDPLAIQIGAIPSLALQGPVMNMAMNIFDPMSFYHFLDGVQDEVPDMPWGKELKYIRLIAGQTEKYSTVIKAAASKVTSQGTYPGDNYLAQQLKIVARLVKGGLKTRIYMVSTGGFDTHSAQVNSLDTTTGLHNNLLSGVSNAIKSFMDDLESMGVADRVIGLTFSEFGRRIKSNGSMGTDHGSAAPMFVFGKNVRPGIVGNNPYIPSGASVNDNVPFQYDFRSVYASILQQWFCVNSTDLETIMLRNFQQLPLAVNAACGTTGLDDIIRGSGEELIINYPNPFVQTTSITFRTKGGHTLVQVMDSLGRVVKTLTDKVHTPGAYTLPFDSHGLPTGVYYARLQNGAIQQVRSMLKVR
ncbi:DUF1501 domain-containing protein [Pseudoflavitalea sp. X16]|uniref:DUF1501 domain-containing protein n=1 Tax=Paraflavitalea devenefica TaxID=2716334 RepID=UPI0014213E17|nr:DUF1501 domain-containing protein [Paraflavitalea devenefica]NII23710.1 DUF1501 domain-containing protein [Paraflavitalea devenefica]